MKTAERATHVGTHAAFCRTSDSIVGKLPISLSQHYPYLRSVSSVMLGSNASDLGILQQSHDSAVQVPFFGGKTVPNATFDDARWQKAPPQSCVHDDAQPACVHASHCAC